MNQERIKKLEHTVNKITTTYIMENLQELSLEHGMIYVTGVKISSDVSYLDIYVSSLKEAELLTKNLAKHAQQLERLMHKEIQIRKLPKLRFRYDKSWENSQVIGNIINEVSSNL